MSEKISYNTPTFYGIGGPNGAGKTTFLKHFFDDKIAVLRPDDLQISDPFILQDTVQSYFKHFASIKESFAFEHNFHTSGSYNYFEWTKKRGYKTKLLYLAIADVQICLDRVNERFVSGRGHFVDEPTIKHRYENSLHNLKVHLKKIDQVSIFDNTDITPLSPCLIFEKGLLVKYNSPPLWLQKFLEHYIT